MNEVNGTGVSSKDEGLLVLNLVNKKSGARVNRTVTGTQQMPFVVTLETNRDSGTVSQTNCYSFLSEFFWCTEFRVVILLVSK